MTSDLKATIRDTLASGLRISRLSDPRVAGRGRLHIATFHRVLPEIYRRAYPIPGLCVTPEELRFFVSAFSRRFTVGTLAQSYQRFRAGERPIKPLLALTFDDAEYDNFEYARPVLQELGVKASFYAPTDHVDSGEPIWHDRLGFAIVGAMREGKEEVLRELLPHMPKSLFEIPSAIEATKDTGGEERLALARAIESELEADAVVPEWARLMTWDEVRVLHREGHEIGSHSCSHAILTQLDDAALSAELHRSKQRIESELETSVTTLCYPNGNADERVARAAERAGYACAVTTRFGSNPASQDGFLLQRCDIDAHHNRDRHGALSIARMQLRMHIQRGIA